MHAGASAIGLDSLHSTHSSMTLRDRLLAPNVTHQHAISAPDTLLAMTAAGMTHIPENTAHDS